MASRHDRNFRVIEYDDNLAVGAVRMWRASKRNALGIDDIHDFDAQLQFLREHLAQKSRVYLAVDSAGEVLGLMALDGDCLQQLYIDIDHQRRGIGSALLAKARLLSPGGLWLYTFERNQKARQFYEKHGFVIAGTGSDNEEGLPDVRYEWRPGNPPG